MDKLSLINKFESTYGKSSDEALRFFFAPGRVNLIGDHIDYNGGTVLPVAISLGITAVVRKRADSKVRLSSTDLATQVIIDMDKAMEYDERAGWGNYPMGVINFLKATNIELVGVDILYHSTLPIGAGLSSSACIEVLTGYLMMTIANIEVDRLALALLCQEVENKFIGVQCGIMDQFAVAMGKQGAAMYLDCNNLACEYVPFNTGEYKLLIMNTNTPRELADSEYNTRKEECLKALEIINKTRPITHLCEASFDEINRLIADPTIKSRAKHVVWENQFVMEAKEELEDGDLKAFGDCMDASHLSLAHDYEVSSDELDLLVDTIRAVDQCLGARMTGAGFGGCAIALVHKDILKEVKEYVKGRYEHATNIEPSFYECEVVDGVKELFFEK